MHLLAYTHSLQVAKAHYISPTFAQIPFFITLGTFKITLGHLCTFQAHLGSPRPTQIHLDTFQLAHIHLRSLKHFFRISHLDASFGIVHLGTFLILFFRDQMSIGLTIYCMKRILFIYLFILLLLLLFYIFLRV